LNLGLLVSGELGFEILKHLSTSNDVRFVLTDSKSENIINYCNENQIDCFAGNPRNGKVIKCLGKPVVDVLLSVNYLFLVEEDVLSIPKTIAINIHGALLPKYRGRTPHVWSIINNESNAGITAHVIDSGCDTGAILEQIVVPILENDTGYSLLLKYKKLYSLVVDSVLRKVKDNTLSFHQQDDSKSTYFPKRTPDDGQINWSWHKERIRNWVRAQALPYPGAFTFYRGQRIIIDKIEYSDSGFMFDMPDGLIISENPVLVKTPNGVVAITEIRNNIEMKRGETLK
jgi:methionyl-tRNA formyltransferase